MINVVKDYGNEKLDNLIQELLYPDLEKSRFKYDQLIIKTDEDELIGGLDYVINDNKTIIKNMVIKPAYQKKGYGNLLIEEALKVLGNQEIIGEGVFNPNSIKILKKNGFNRKIKGIFNYYPNLKE